MRWHSGIHKFVRLAIHSWAIFIFFFLCRTTAEYYSFSVRDYASHLLCTIQTAVGERHFMWRTPNAHPSVANWWEHCAHKCSWVTYQNVNYDYFIHRKCSRGIFLYFFASHPLVALRFSHFAFLNAANGSRMHVHFDALLRFENETLITIRL